MQSSDNQLKIAVFTSDTVPYYHGSGRNAFLFSSAMNHCGISSKVISLNKWFHFPYKNHIENSVVYRLPLSQRNLFWKALTAPICLAFYFYHIKTSTHLVLFGRIMGYELILLFAKLLRKPVIFQSTLLHSDDLTTILQRNIIVRKLKLTKILKGYFAINSKFKQLSEHHLKEETPILCTPQGVDTKRFSQVDSDKKSELRKKYNLSSQSLVFSTIGIVCLRKGYKALFYELSKLSVDFKLIVVGDYNPSPNNCFYIFRTEMLELKEYGEKLLGDKVIFLGTTDEAHEVLQLSDYFIFNSNHEGTPNAILEAMSCKTPIICKHLEGIGDILNSDTAFVYQKDSEITDAITSALATKTNPRPDNAYKLIMEHYSIDVVVREFMKTFIDTSKRNITSRIPH